MKLFKFQSNQTLFLFYFCVYNKFNNPVTRYICLFSKRIHYMTSSLYYLYIVKCKLNENTTDISKTDYWEKIFFNVQKSQKFTHK